MTAEDTIPGDVAPATPPAAGAPAAEPATPPAAGQGVAERAGEAAEAAVDAVAPAAEAAVGAADNAGSWAQRQGENLSNWWSGFTEDMTGWDAAGIIGVGLIMWVLGNAFGGGGLLGLVISTMLMGFVVANNGQIGRDLGGVLQNMFGGEDSPQREASVQPQRQPEVAQETPAVAPAAAALDPVSLRAADEAVALADFSTDAVPGTLTLPPRVTQAVGRV